MAKLTARQRAALPSKCFALPKKRKYPIPDWAHVGFAKGRAKTQRRRRRLTRREYLEIKRRLAKGPC